MKRIFLAAAFASFSGLCIAAPPPGADMSLAPWYKSLVVPQGDPGIAGTMCCSVADCRNVDDRTREGHYEAYIDSATFPDDPSNEYHGRAPNAWVAVPEERIIRGRDNPTGRAVACWYHGEIRCFVPGSGT